MMHLTESIDMKDGRASHNLTFLKDLSKPTCAQHKKEEVRRSFLDQMRACSHAGNSLLIFDVDLMNEDLHLSVCKEANFYILLRSHFSRSRPSTYSISAIMFQRFFLFAINAYKNSFRQPFHVLYYAREESPAPIACLATILSHLLQLSHSTLCVANILI